MATSEPLTTREAGEHAGTVLECKQTSLEAVFIEEPTTNGCQHEADEQTKPDDDVQVDVADEVLRFRPITVVHARVLAMTASG